MKSLSELSEVLLTMNSTEDDPQENKVRITKELHDTCDDIIKLTKGPVDALAALGIHTTLAVGSVVELKDDQLLKVHKAVSNALKMVLAVYIIGGAVEVTKRKNDIETILEALKENGALHIDDDDAEIMGKTLNAEDMSKTVEELMNEIKQGMVPKKKEVIH